MKGQILETMTTPVQGSYLLKCRDMLIRTGNWHAILDAPRFDAKACYNIFRPFLTAVRWKELILNNRSLELDLLSG